MVEVVVVGGGGPRDYIVSSLGQVIVIVIGRPRSLTIKFMVGVPLSARLF